MSKNNKEVREPKPVKERDNLDLLELALELHARTISLPTHKGLHDAAIEAKEELKKRLYQPPLEGSGEVGLRQVKALPEVLELDGYINKIVHSRGDLETRRIQQLFWSAIDAIQKQYTLPSNSNVERFKKPEADKIIKAAILFNDGRMDRKQLSNMVALCYWVIDRLYENGDITIPSSKENKEDGKV